MNQRGRQRDDEKMLLKVLCTFFCVFVLLGAVYRFAPLDGIKSVFPLLGGVSARLDQVAWKLKAGLPIPEAAETFFYEAFANANPN